MQLDLCFISIFFARSLLLNNVVLSNKVYGGNFRIKRIFFGIDNQLLIEARTL